MGWVHSGDLKVILLQGVLPLVVGISICIVGALVVAGIISFPCCKRHDDQIFPVFVMAGSEDSDDNDNSTTRGRAYGPVACKAQLYGMKPKERQAVLEAVFRSCTQKESLEKLEEGTADDIKTTNEEDVKVKAGEWNLDTRCACAICLRDYGTYGYALNDYIICCVKADIFLTKFTYPNGNYQQRVMML